MKKLALLFCLVVAAHAQITSVNSINGVPGPFTFNGSGVSCAGVVCTFSGGSGGSTSIETNGTLNTSQALLNFTNPSNFNGLTFTFSNPSGGVETFALGGALTALGTVTAGTWDATAIAPTYGGTGLNTSSATGFAQVSSGTWSVAALTSSNITTALGYTPANCTPGTTGSDCLTLTSGKVATANLGSGTASSTTFLTGAQTYAAPFALTTTGSSGAATFSAGTLNIPQYSGGSSSTVLSFAQLFCVGDSYMYGSSAASRTVNSICPLVAASMPGIYTFNYTNDGVSSQSAADSVNTLFNNFASFPLQPSFGLVLGGNNDGTSCGTSTNCLKSFQGIWQAGIGFISIPIADRIMATLSNGTTQAWTQVNGGDGGPTINTQPQVISSFGYPAYTTVSGATKTFTTGASTVVGVTYQVAGSRGTFTISIDGTLQTDLCSSTTTFTDQACGNVGMSGQSVVPFEQFFSGLANTTHTVVITTTNSNEVSIQSVDWVPSSCTTLCGGVVAIGPNAYFTGSSNYDSQWSTLVTAMSGYGMPVFYASEINGNPGVNSTTDINTSSTTTCNASNATGHPNSTCGYFKMAQTVYNAAVAGNYYFAHPPAPPLTPGSGSGGDTITSPNSTINVGGTSSATTVDLNGAAGKIMAGATPALTYTPTLGVAGTANGTLTLASITASGSITLTPASAASAFTATIPANTGTLGELNLAQTWSALQTFGTNISIGGVTAAGATGTSNVVFSNSPTLVTPAIGAATATTVNGLSLTANSTGFSVAGGTTSKTLTVSNTMTLAGTDSSTYTFPGASATISQTIASGTSTLGTSSISSGACASAVTTTATGTATTDVVWWGFNGDPSGVTGYAPATTGMLTILAYPSSGNVNFKVCNNTSASVTPGAITLNWRIVR